MKKIWQNSWDLWGAGDFVARASATYQEFLQIHPLASSWRFGFVYIVFSFVS